jgi:hypothetical protein
MKNIKNVAALLMLIMLVGTFGCKKEPVSYNKNMQSFKFIIQNGAGVDTEYLGTISDGRITVILPTEADVTNLKAVFTTENPRTIVQIGSVVQESGISVQDFTRPVKYIVKAEDKSTQAYTVVIDKKVGIKSFGFYKEDNPALTQNYIGVIRGLTIEIGLPESVNLTALVARYETSLGAVLKVGATTQESTKTANNFTSTIVYAFTDATITTPINYNVTSYFLGSQWLLIADDLTKGVTASGLKMAISPITNYPYFIYQRTGKDEAGVTIPTDNRKVAVIGFNGNTWQNIGAQSGVSEFRADVPGIAVDKDGTVHIAYKDYFGAAQTATVMKYVNADWVPVGPKRFTPVKVDYLSFALTDNNVPVVSMAKTGTDATGVPARGVYVMNYLNAAWANITPPGGITVFYDQVIKGLDGKLYLGIMDRSTGVNKPSLYKYENNVWVAVGPTSFTAPDNLVGFQGVSIAVDKDGQAYLAYQAAPSSGRINHVMKYNKTTNTWQELGNAVLSGGTSDNFALAVDGLGKLYFAYANASSLIVKTFNNETNNWNTERKVINEKVLTVGNGFDMQIAADGTVYVVANIASNNKTVVYKLAK